MTSISKPFYFDVLGDIVNKYNNTVHRAIETKFIEFTDDSYAEYNENFNKKGSKFKAGDNVRVWKYKIIFAKGYSPNWSEEVFVISKIKNTVPWTYVINDLNSEEITGDFYEKQLQKISQKKNLEYKKCLKEIVINYMSHGKGAIIHLIVGLMRKTLNKNEPILS